LVLDLVEQGRAEELARAVQPHADRIDAVEEFPGAVAVAITVAAYRSGAGRWRNSWTEGPELVDVHGVELPIDDIARLAAAPATVDTARKRLADAGISVTSARQESTAASAVDATLLGGLANMKSGKAIVDVLVLSNGLVLVPAPKSTDHGRRRLRGLIDSAPVADLARAHRFVAYEDIASARVLKAVPVRVAITLHDGETVELLQPWTGETLTKGDDDLLREAIAPYVDVR
jgi:hypothetical protein